MSGHDAAFAKAYAAYFKHVHAYCRRRLDADRVDDAVAEVFLVAWRKISDLPAGEDALPWLYRVAFGVTSNLWRTAFRQRKLRRKLDSVGLVAGASPEGYVVVGHEHAQILEALDGLRAEEQEVLRLSFWEGLSNSQLAIALGTSVDAAKQRLSRAKRQLALGYDKLEGRNSVFPVARKGGAR